MAQIVVIHRRQVVVDQRIGVDEFHRAGGSVQRFECGADRRAGRINQHRPDALAAAQHRVAHGLMQIAGMEIGGRQSLVERLRNTNSVLLDHGLDHGALDRRFAERNDVCLPVPFNELVHFLLSGLQCGLTRSYQADALLESLQRFLQSQLTLFELSDQRFQFGQGGFEGNGGGRFLTVIPMGPFLEDELRYRVAGKRSICWWESASMGCCCRVSDDC
jgi:hypothetical protein